MEKYIKYPNHNAICVIGKNCFTRRARGVDEKFVEYIFSSPILTILRKFERN